jgi:hypothetical protein
MKRDKVAEAYEADRRHGKTEFNPRCEQEE